MAVVFRASHRPEAPESDYGSDFSTEEASIVIQLLERLEDRQGDSDSCTATEFTDPVSEVNLERAATAPDVTVLSQSATRLENVSTPGLHVVNPTGSSSTKLPGTPTFSSGNPSVGDIEDELRPRSMPLYSLEHPDLSRTSPMDPATSLPHVSKPEAFKSSAAEITKSPIERFRSFPKKPLTVTDLSSGAWCELQYWYTLTLLPGGRKTKTTAMRGGTKVHKTLEDQVHSTVQISVAFKEEAFALRLWNFIQGLRTLRDKGLTRELEVWGVVQGQVVNGVIDEVSYTSPNTAFEEELRQNQPPPNDTGGLSHNQPSILSYLEPPHRYVYLTDVKTRGSNTLPSGAAVRPAKVQLLLYHRLLGAMAAGQLDFSIIMARYGLHPETRFSDAFMAQIGSIHEDIFEETGHDAESPAKDVSLGGYPDLPPTADSRDTSPPDMMSYRSIQQIIPLVLSELRVTFPQGAATLGELVAVQYRHREDGRIIGNQSFSIDPEALNRYLKLDLAWWFGERNPDGVPIEEAYKCGYCEFAERCHWRKDRDDEIIRKSTTQNRAGSVYAQESSNGTMNALQSQSVKSRIENQGLCED